MLNKRGWVEKNYQVLSDLIRTYRSGDQTMKYHRNYVVSDWDNTSAMFDSQDGVFLYQLFHLRYAMDPDEFSFILRKDLEMEDPFVEELIQDIEKNYRYLYSKKGSLSLEEWKKEERYCNFVGEMAYFYNEFLSRLDYGLACHRILYLFYRMTEEELRTLAREALDFWSQCDLQIMKFPFRLGEREFVSAYQVGIRKIEQQADLYRECRANNIDVYICTASSKVIIEEMASSELLGYGFSGNEVTGMVIAKDEDGRFLAEADKDHPVTYCEGKANFLSLLEEKYQRPPILFMGDSDGDYYALSYPNLKVGLIVNLTKEGKINELKELAKSEKKDATLYLLQGRDESKGEFIPVQESMELAK